MSLRSELESIFKLLFYIDQYSINMLFIFGVLCCLTSKLRALSVTKSILVSIFVGS